MSLFCRCNRCRSLVGNEPDDEQLNMSDTFTLVLLRNELTLTSGVGADGHMIYK